MNQTANRPKVSAFPKCYIDALSTGKMDLFKSSKCCFSGCKGPLIPDRTIHNNYIIGTNRKIHSSVPAI